MKKTFGLAEFAKLTTTCIATVLTAVCFSGRPVVAQGITVSDGPPVGLILLDNLMSGKSRVGDPVHYETLANVYDDDKNLLIPAGSLAVGRVTRSRGSGMFGKRGELNFTCKYVVLPDGTNVPLVGSKIRTAGTNDTAATAAVTVLVSPLGLLIKGGTVKVNQGTPVEMYVADGTVINPTQANPTNIRADFTLKDKHAPDVVGAIQGFDGNSYQVAGDEGNQTVALSDIANISLEVPPVMGSQGN